MPGVLGALVASGALAGLGGVPAVADGPATGTLYAWGQNSVGQLGDGSTTSHRHPEVITLAPGVAPTSVSAGVDGHTLAVGSNGTLYAWGINNVGQLGDGTTTSHPSPEPVTLSSGVTTDAAVAGWGDSLAIGSNGTLYAWGINNAGQLGDGTTTSRHTPEAITLAPGVTPTAVAAGGWTSYAIGSDGKLYGWGLDQLGQLGRGPLRPHLRPSVVSLPAGVQASSVSAGPDGHALVLGSDGRLYDLGTDGGSSYGGGSYGGSSGHTSSPRGPAVLALGPSVTPVAFAAGTGGTNLVVGSDGKLDAFGAGGGRPQVLRLARGVSAIGVAAGRTVVASGSDANLYVFGHPSGDAGGRTSMAWRGGRWSDDGATDGDSSGDGGGDGGDHGPADPPEVVTLPGGVAPTALAVGDDDGFAIGSAGPAPVLPEVPAAVWLPVLGGAVGGATWWAARRRHRPRAA